MPSGAEWERGVAGSRRSVDPPREDPPPATRHFVLATDTPWGRLASFPSRTSVGTFTRIRRAGGPSRSRRGRP